MRLVTRADWDGLVCAALLRLVEDIDSIKFIEPGEFQSGALTITSNDIIANLPYREGCGKWFDHHLSNKIDHDFEGAWWVALSAARVIYTHYNSDKFNNFDDLLEITDRIDGAKLTLEEVKHPQGYVLASMTIEGKRLEDEPYWLRLIDLIGNNDLEELIHDPIVNKNCREYQSINKEFGIAIINNSRLDGNVLITDFRGKWHGEPGNRFLAYTLFPSCNIWVKASDHPNDPKLSHITAGHSIFNRTSNAVIGEMMAKYGGGGHRGAGTCRPPKEESDRVFAEIIEASREG
mgnify:CR=1 FL=1